MAQALITQRYTPQEYYRLERAASHKSEFVHGEITAMAGGSSRHSLIISNLLREIGNRLKGKPCAPYNGDQRLRVQETGLRTYPDAAIYCDKLEYDPEDDQSETATNPSAIFEVLSDSTEAYDRGPKWAHYRRIPSLKAYVLISQSSPFVEMFHIVEGRGWQFTEASGLDTVMHIPCIGIDLSLAELYDRITWSAEEPNAMPVKG